MDNNGLDKNSIILNDNDCDYQGDGGYSDKALTGKNRCMSHIHGSGKNYQNKRNSRQ